MRRGCLIFLLLTLWVPGALAQVSTGPGGRPFPRRVLVADLPASGSQELLIITDGANAQDCTAGGGNTRVLCAYNPATLTWEALGDGNQAGVGGAPSTAQYLVAAGDATLSQELVLGIGVILRGTHAAIPSAGIAGRLYLYTDAPFGIARDTGVAWEELTLDWSKVTAKAIINADVDPTAGIVESKLTLNFPTHSNANDPTADEKSGLAANSPSAANPVLTQIELTTHSADTTGIHGITDTSALALTTDPRFTDQRVPTNDSVTSLKIVAGAIEESDLNSALLGPASTVFGLRKLGTTSTEAAAGNDARLSDQRVPTNDSVTSAKIFDGTIVADDISATYKDGAAGTPSLRTLGTGATQAASGADSRLSDSRTPTAHAASHFPAGSDDLSSIYATKAYADAIAAGLQPKVRTHLATTTTLPANTYSNGASGVGATLTRGTNGTVGTIDGDALSLNEYLLVKDEASDLKHGIYQLTQVGDGSNPYILTRRTDVDQDAEVNPGVSTYVERGTASTGNLGKTFFITTPDPITVGTTGIAWDVFQSSTGSGTGAGLTSGGDVGSGTCITVGADTVGVTSDCLTDTQVATANKDGAAGTASLRTLGTGATQAAAGNDSRLSDTRTPSDNSVTTGKIVDGAIIEGDLNAALLGPASATYGLRKLGTAATEAAAGNDARLSDQRTPSDNSVTSAKILDGTIVDADVAAANKDGAAGTASLRTLGTGATQAAAGNDSRLSDTRTPTDNSVTSAKILDETIVSADLSPTAEITKGQLSNAGTFEPSELPLPTLTTPGGAIAKLCNDPDHLSAFNPDGTFTCTAPSLSTGSAAIAIAELPATDTEGTTYLIDDGVSGDDCTEGFGDHTVWCKYDSALETWFAVAAPSLQRACESGGGTCGFTNLTEALPFVEAPLGLDGPRSQTFGRSGDFVRQCVFGAVGSEQPCDPEPIFVHRDRLWEILYETGSPNSFEVLGSIENINGTVLYEGILQPTGQLSACNTAGTTIATFDGTDWSCEDLPSLGIQQSTLQIGYDIGTGIISGVTAAKPLRFTGNDVDGAGFDFYESAGDMFFECKLSDGTPCHHAFELATNRQFSIGTSTRPDAWVIRHAEPETMDVECRTTDPTTPTANRLKTYCKDDGAYTKNDAGNVSALVAGDDASTTAQNIVAYTGTGGKNVTELTGTQGDVLYHNGTSWVKLTAGTSGHFLKTNGAGANPTWAAAAGGGPVAPIRPYSAIPVTAGMVYAIIIDGDEMLGVTTATLLTSDAIWRLGFEMPPTLATGCTYKLQVDMKANATSGVIRINPKWNTWAPGVSRTSLTLNAETVTPDSVTGAAGAGDTVTLGAADTNQLIRIKWTLNASTVTAAQRMAMDLVFEDASYTLAVESGYLPSIICE